MRVLGSELKVLSAVDSYDPADFFFAQQHLRILSGLYGLLRPLDLMQPYRLEMGAALPTERGVNLFLKKSARLPIHPGPRLRTYCTFILIINRCYSGPPSDNGCLAQ